MRDTVAGNTGRRLAAGLVALWLIAITAAAAAGAPGNRVLWARAERVYVALADTSGVQEGDSARFDDRGKLLGAGRVGTIVHREMAVVRLTSGSLAGVRKLERVRVAFVAPTRVFARSLRVALPSGGRKNLIVPCPAGEPDAVSGLGGGTWHRAGPAGDRPLRFLRQPDAAFPNAGPDTLGLFFFDDATDEEIALERGDVDVAVFWPGELSRRIREDARWSGFSLGRRARGVLVLVGADGVADAAPDTVNAQALNEELFRGDLALRTLPGRREEAHPPTWTLYVDERLPGRDTLIGWLSGRAWSPGWPSNRPTIARALPVARLAYLDAPADTLSSPGLAPLFTLRCPVVSAPAARPIIQSLGADAFANLMVCGGAR